MVFYEIQETTDRWLYDSTVIGAAPLLLFAPALTEVHRKQRVVFELERWHMAVDVRVADELLKLRLGCCRSSQSIFCANIASNFFGGLSLCI